MNFIFRNLEQIEVEDLGFLRAWSLFEREDPVGFSFRYIEVGPHCEVPMVVHAVAREVVFILDGEGEFLVAGQSRRCRKGDFVHVPPGTPHSMRTLDKSVRFVAVESPPVHQGQDFHLQEGEEPPP